MADSFYAKRKAAIRGCYCILCQTKRPKFTNHISEEEYLISALCEECQDRLYGKLPFSWENILSEPSTDVADLGQN